MIRISIRIKDKYINFNELNRYMGVVATKTLTKKGMHIWEYGVIKNYDNIEDGEKNILVLWQDISSILNSSKEKITCLKNKMSIVFYVNNKQYNFSFILNHEILRQIYEIGLPIEIELSSKGLVL